MIGGQVVVIRPFLTTLVGRVDVLRAASGTVVRARGNFAGVRLLVRLCGRKFPFQNGDLCQGLNQFVVRTYEL